VLNAYTLTA